MKLWLREAGSKIRSRCENCFWLQGGMTGEGEGQGRGVRMQHKERQQRSAGLYPSRQVFHFDAIVFKTSQLQKSYPEPKNTLACRLRLAHPHQAERCW